MRLDVEQTKETRDWSNNDFNPRFLTLHLVGDLVPTSVTIYFADKELIFQKGLFEGMAHLSYKPDPNGPAYQFKRAASIAIDKRYAFYYVKIDQPQLVQFIESVP